jgi:hypothetical protein
VKSFVLWKLPLILVGLGAALFLSPACKAQSEVNPDHFDGTDSWQTAVAHQAPIVGHNQAKTAVQTQTQNKKPVSGASVQLAAARQGSQAARPEVVALQDKRSASKGKPNNP